MKKILLVVLLLGAAVAAYLNRRWLGDKFGQSYRAATNVVRGVDSKETAEPGSDANKKTNPVKKSPSTENHTTKGSPSTGGNSNSSAIASNAADAEAPPKMQETIPPTTNVMIVGSGSSIGDIDSSDIFGDARVYTTYIEMKQPRGPISEWTLQYALLDKKKNPSGPQPERNLQSVQMDPAVHPPIPIQKPYPQFPPEIVAQHPGSVVVVSATINTSGKMEQIRLLPGSDPRLEQPVLEALHKWSFQPARMDGSPVSVNSLLGIVLPEAL